jgi:hypothetical protein
MKKFLLYKTKIRKIAVFTILLFCGVSVQCFGQNNTVKDTINSISPGIKTQTLEKVEAKQGIQKPDNSESIKLEIQEPALNKINDNEINEPQNNSRLVNGNSLNNGQDTSHSISNPHFIKNKIDAIKNTESLGNDLKAVPTNDDNWSGGGGGHCNAITVPVDGTCLTGQTNISSTPDYYGGCVPAGDNSVWYKFTITGSNNMINITFTVPGSLGGNSLGQGGVVDVFLFEGTCKNPSGVKTICDLASAAFTFESLSAGTYYLQVSTPAGMEGNFNICATQSIAPIGSITGPEQDCSGAIPICQSSYSFTGSYLGHGASQELSSTSSCLLGKETNSVWYIFTVQTSGTFGFNIVTLKDYDFALYDITTTGCSGIPTATPVRCNFSDDFGNTGLTLPPSATIPLSIAATGLPTMPGLDVTVGSTYVLIVDNWTGDNNGFDINFLGTASIYDNILPTMTTIVPSCTDNTIMLTMSEDIKCLSVQQSDFQLILLPSTDVTSKITQITGYNCPVTNGAMTSQIQITTDGTLVTGQYQLVINPDPSLADKCDNIILAGSTINFNYLAAITLLATPTSICPGATISLNADGADGSPTSLTTYTISPGGLTNTTDGVFNGLAPYITTNYSVSATYGGCTRIASASVTVEGNIVTSISPTNKTVCALPTTLTASTTINGVACVGCTYVWSTAQTINPISVGSAGTYSVTATTPGGCPNGNSPSSTISLASSGNGGGTCDVIYVSPAGGGTGNTKTSPTTLAIAIANAQCTYTVIKMQRGVYTLTDYQAIHSYVTIEGGYDATFTTKYSDMTGGSNSTTIRRSNAADSGYPANCTAFWVDDGGELFRIQDIRIEMPGSPNVTGHSVGAGITNYGIKLGTGCTGYNIVRCYIDAGVGSAPTP